MCKGCAQTHTSRHTRADLDEQVYPCRHTHTDADTLKLYDGTHTNTPAALQTHACTHAPQTKLHNWTTPTKRTHIPVGWAGEFSSRHSFDGWAKISASTRSETRLVYIRIAQRHSSYTWLDAGMLTLLGTKSASGFGRGTAMCFIESRRCSTVPRCILASLFYRRCISVPRHWLNMEYAFFPELPKVKLALEQTIGRVPDREHSVFISVQVCTPADAQSYGK